MDDEPPPWDDYAYDDRDAPDAPPPSNEDAPDRAKNRRKPERLRESRWPELNADAIFGPLQPVNYLLETFDVCPGAPTLVAGVGFSGKTVALQSTALSVATGLPVWGQFSVRLGKVLHIDYEQGEHLTRKKYQRLAASMMIGPGDVGDRLALVSMPQIYLDMEAAEAFLAKRCAGTDLVIIDSLRAACPSIEENDSGARTVLDMLNRVSAKTGACFVVIHHARKPQRDAPGGARATIRGSGAIFDACGSVLVFEAGKGESIRVSHEKARTSGRLSDDISLRIEDQLVDGAPRGGLTVTAEAISQHTPDRSGARKVDEMKAQIITYLQTHGTAPGKNALSKRIAGDRNVFYAAVAELEAVGSKPGIINTSTNKNRPRLVLCDEVRS
jgi:hypothetical protein